MYPFPGLFAIDPFDPSNVAENAQVTIFNPSDSSRAPLTLTDSEGLIIENPLTTNDKGFVGAFMAELDEVGWFADNLVGYIFSNKGTREAAQTAADTAAALAGVAENAQRAAEQAASLVGVPADNVTATLIGNPETGTGAAVRTVIEDANLVPRAATVEAGGLTFKSSYREWSAPLRSNGPGGGGLAIGEGAAENISEYTDAYDSRDFIAIGRDALKNATSAPLSMAFGAGAMSKGTGGFGNQAFGTWSLMHVSGGHRNIGFGSLTMPFLTTGYQNTIMGRDAGQGFLTARRNVGIGYRSLGCGHQPVGLSGEIEHQFISNAEDCVAMGNDALRYTTGYKNVGIGPQAGAAFTNSWGNTFVGADVAAQFGIDVSENGFALNRTVKTGTYSQAGTTLTVTVTGHGAMAGKKVGLTFSAGLGTAERQWLIPSSIPDADTLVFTSPKELNVAGTVTIDTVETATTVTPGRQITIVGQGSAAATKAIGNNTSMFGADAGPNASGAANTLIGSRSGGNLTTGDKITALGYNAGRALVGGGNMTTETNVTALGNDAQASGSNQVQLGNSATTTYVYGTVQNRSDRRDKADVRDTVLGLDFITQLRPVDYRWDMREDYEDFIPDGSMKRERFHHGLIAQEVAKVIETTGQDFGGFQDHTVSGGSDVLSIGYDELIAPIIKSIQQINNRVLTLEGAA